ncbi:RNA exonuclease 3 [Kluyveromyces marxianus]|uniref:RNA exonuclease 3 n=2 Tax=Kluyveromyces marxianus TaxID=4911 RepID=W0TAX7_KLUMD|nr:RNA exonuclease 3 [Kluyveromyces marxianus DMKU3-1042]QGN15932.1 RNA exonuclease 3 [Kluyveromyces marxianus]BAO40193.1 RNA exonuclease 3 [Kluyveromyces marxianus DMKU3-1042]BAP71689.1 RNA exonuclease 3 [Kluyveromyces marxianus]
MQRNVMMNKRLRPSDMKMQPAPYQVRVDIVKKIYTQLKKFRQQEADSETQKTSVRWEHEIAKVSKSKQGYMFNASVMLRNIIKYKGDLDDKGAPLDTKSSLIKKSAVLEKLRTLLLDEETLSRNGFFVNMYDTEPESNQDSNFMECCRCETKFDISKIMEPTVCQYHVQRKVYNRESKKREFPCCGASLESYSDFSAGCSKASHHVYKFENFTRLSEVLPFKSLKDVDGEENVLALDCEMAFTSKGYEMIRLTIVDFWTSKIVYDKVIKPLGEVIDLNSKFSGIHHIDDSAPTIHETEKDYIGPNMINKNTLLIGHGLDNDLRVMRIVHDKIIDTAVLYPAGKFKSSLKNLSFEVLSRKIQGGEHDSSEDAIAAMDIIKKKIGVPLDKTSW